MESTEQVTGEKAHPALGCAPAPLLSLAAAVTAAYVGAVITHFDAIGRPLPDLIDRGDHDA